MDYLKIAFGDEKSNAEIKKIAINKLWELLILNIIPIDATVINKLTTTV
jgi:hypothetical protein